MTRLIVHIDALVLRGVRHEDRHALAEGLSLGLSRQLADVHDARTLRVAGAVAQPLRVDAPVAADASPFEVGSLTAQAIVRKLGS